MGTVELEQWVDAPAEAVWRALTDAEERQAWFDRLELDARPGGRLLERWHDAEGEERMTRGEVLEAQPGRLLRATWRDDGWPADTQLQIDLDDQGGLTRLTLRHTGWDDLPDGDLLAELHEGGWAGHLDRLAAHARGVTRRG